MPPEPEAFVLDSWAVIAFFGDEPGGGNIADLIIDSHKSDIPIYMCVVNLGEVWYITARAISEAAAYDIVKALHDMRIEFVDADWTITQRAAQIKSRHKMSYTDCYAAALASSKNAALVTGDKEFKAIENQVDIQWV
jgi:predicted nucleic acid-binding protein